LIHKYLFLYVTSSSRIWALDADHLAVLFSDL
jgi:hypothetical protein